MLKPRGFSQLAAGFLAVGSFSVSPTTCPSALPSPLTHYSSSSLSPTSDVQDETLEQLAEEIKAANRVVNILKREGTTTWAVEYLEHTHDLFKILNDEPTPIQPGLPSFIIMRLRLARQQLLDSAPKAKDWIQVARALQPDQTPVLPRRLIKKTSSKEENTINWGVIEASVWSSSITIG
ncbi:MAG: hypothetical protein H6727_07270 [Myxococcales bacterium]|nr:hypothetical protein [Myxococcales bacterium]